MHILMLIQTKHASANLANVRYFASCCWPNYRVQRSLEKKRKRRIRNQRREKGAVADLNRKSEKQERDLSQE